MPGREKTVSTRSNDSGVFSPEKRKKNVGFRKIVEKRRKTLLRSEGGRKGCCEEKKPPATAIPGNFNLRARRCVSRLQDNCKRQREPVLSEDRT